MVRVPKTPVASGTLARQFLTAGVLEYRASVSHDVGFETCRDVYPQKMFGGGGTNGPGENRNAPPEVGYAKDARKEDG